jgi:hypothetical protein
MLPMFAAMEAMGVITALISPPVTGFHVVEKESKTLKKRASEKELSQYGKDDEEAAAASKIWADNKTA